MTQTLPDAIDTSMDGAGLLEFLQQFYESVLSNHEGGSVPSYLPTSGMYYDTTDNTFKVKTVSGTDTLLNMCGHSEDHTSNWRILGSTLECWGRATISTGGTTITFPKTFAAAPYVRGGVVTGGAASGIAYSATTDTGVFSTTQVRFSIARDDTGDSGGTVDWYAIGEWDGIS